MKHYVIEPLGVMHLAGIARKMGVEVKIFLYKDFDFEPLFEDIRTFKPDLVGFSVWTGAHTQSFVAAERVRRMGISVVIGGPHATYFSDDCAVHADRVAKGDGFRILRYMLGDALPSGVHEGPQGIFFDSEAKADEFPLPDRDVVYERYPDLGANPIKSMMCSTGCPFSCSYCNSPYLNEMYGGFKNVFRVRPIDDLIREARAVADRWGVKMFYFQDDIFGFDVKWLEEFAPRWRREVGVPWHCQIRLELTREDIGLRRLELFREGLCSGITLAIESGSDFLREFVLLRPMPHELIVEGCNRIMDLGFTLRTEQILQVPFSNLETDLQTLALNVEINPTMAWCSILAPFGETDMGKIAKRFGFYGGTNDDLDESFYFDYSQLRHTETGREAIEPVVRGLAKNHRRFESPLLSMYAEPVREGAANVFYRRSGDSVPTEGPLCELQFMDALANKRYCDQTARYQRVFNWLAKLPDGHVLGRSFADLPEREMTWDKLGELAEKHLFRLGYGERIVGWKEELARGLNCSRADELPPGVRDNPLYFCFFPSSSELARKMVKEGVFNLDTQQCFNRLGDIGRKWLFGRGVYRVEDASPPIACR